MIYLSASLKIHPDVKQLKVCWKRFLPLQRPQKAVYSEISPKFEEMGMNRYCHCSAVNKFVFVCACKNLSKTLLAMLANPR